MIEFEPGDVCWFDNGSGGNVWNNRDELLVQKMMLQTFRSIGKTGGTVSADERYLTLRCTSFRNRETDEKTEAVKKK